MQKQEQKDLERITTFLYFYTKGEAYTFNQQYYPYPEEEIKKRFRKKDEKGYYKDAELGTMIQMKP